MSAGPMSDLINAQQAGPPQGLGQSNTGAGQFLGGPLTPADFKIGTPPYVPAPQDQFNPVRGLDPNVGPDGYPIGVQGNYTKQPNTPQYNPNARPWMGGGNQGLLNTRMR